MIPGTYNAPHFELRAARHVYGEASRQGVARPSRREVALWGSLRKPVRKGGGSRVGDCSDETSTRSFSSDEVANVWPHGGSAGASVECVRARRLTLRDLGIEAVARARGRGGISLGQRAKDALG